MFRPAVIEIHEQHVSHDGTSSWTESRIDRFDATDLLIELIGDDEDLLLAMVEDHREHDHQVSRLLAQHPDVSFEPCLDDGFDLLHVFAPELDRSASDDDVVAAWKRWKTDAAARDDVHAWARKRWSGLTTTIEDHLSGRDENPEVALEFARAVVGSPMLLEALAQAFETWPGDPMEGLRAVARFRARLDGIERP